MTQSQKIINSFLSAEDKNFFSHPGIDAKGIVRATVNNVRNIINDKRLEGASTITQQVAKNFLLTNEVSLRRKIKEAILAFRIEKAYTKERIFRTLFKSNLSWRRDLRNSSGQFRIF